MFARNFALTLALAALLSGAAGAALADGNGLLSARLVKALETADKTAAESTSALTVWVNFSPRELSGAALADALREAESQLPHRLWERRLRQDSPVGPADLPVGASRIAGVAATGAAFRKESRWLNAASFTATPDQIAAIASLPFVASVDLVGRLVRGPQPEITPEQIAAAEAAAAEALAAKTFSVLDYGASKAVLDEVNITQLHDDGLSGRGVTIAVFDTGFDLSHECLQDVDVVAAWDFVNEDSIVYNQPKDPEESADHGTQILGSLMGYSPGNLIGPAYGASVILAKTEDIAREVVAEEDNWIAALEWAVGLGADVVSSSIGYYVWYDWSDLDGDTAPITIAADMAALRGTVVVVGVGMMRFDPQWPHILAPSDGNHVLSVGMADRGGYVAGWSSPGPTYDGRIKPDVLAIGVGNITPVPWTTDVYYFASGTDMSVTLVAGAAALMLERNPGLTPLQVNEALRMTASRSLLPDNDYGWGAVDALGAGRYWQPAISHEPLDKQPSIPTGFTITATITSRLPLVEGAQALFWRVNGGDWLRLALSPGIADTWSATIPRQSNGKVVEYYFVAANDLGQATIWPDPEQTSPFRFEVGTDSEPPVIVHTPLRDQAAANWPPRIFARVEDDGVVDNVKLVFALNGSSYPGQFDLAEVTDGWAIDFPLSIALPPGTKVSYSLIAQDQAAIPHISVAGNFEFEVVEHLASILIVDDHFVPGTKEAAGTTARGASQILQGEKAGSASYAAWLQDAGYTTETVSAEDFTAADIIGHDVVFYTSGNYLAPMGFPELRDGLVNWVRQGGRILIESGELGYVTQGQTEFQDLVTYLLRSGPFLTDDGYELHTSPAAAKHPLVTYPHALASPLRVAVPAGVYDWGAADVFLNFIDCEVVMHSGYGSGTGGVVVHDDTSGPAAGQSVYFSFDLNYVETGTARRLLENAMAYLTVEETGGPSTISGRVTLAGRSDHSGVTVSAGRGIEAITAADGTYILEGLWGGEYRLSLSAPNFSASRRLVTLGEGEARSGVDFTLVPVHPVDVGVSPGLAIPDNEPLGVSSALPVVASGRVMGVRVEVDIQHFAQGDLVVMLTSPGGTTVRLHDRTGGLNDNLVGEWPTTLWVAGPGSLEDFLGEEASGNWKLTVKDLAFGASGRLRGWVLHLLVADQAPASAHDAGGQTRIIGNAPNPFNPRTMIGFELAETGPVRLDIFDVRGRLVVRLAEGEYVAGRHQVAWADDKASSGIYFARLTAGGRTEVHKMTLLR